LWHKDFGAEARRKREEQESVRLEELRRAKAEQAAMKARAKQDVHQVVSHQQGRMMLMHKRRRLVELISGRAWMLYVQRS
jgi:hypothetical protein